MMPLLAVPLVPSITALQLGPVSLSWACLRLPVATPVVALYEVRFTCQGRPVAVRVKGSQIGPLQWVKLPEVTEPIPVPDSPPPCLSVPLTCEDVHTSTVPVLVSRTVSRPDIKETEPPGRTVQVAAARTVVTPTTATRTAAGAATRGRAYRVLIRCLLPEPGSEPGIGSLPMCSKMRRRVKACRAGAIGRTLPAEGTDRLCRSPAWQRHGPGLQAGAVATPRADGPARSAVARNRMPPVPGRSPAGTQTRPRPW